jgi:hypothetical protein
MTMKSLVALWMAAGLLLISVDASAWSRYGHEVTGHLAAAELSPEAAAMVDELLNGRSLGEVAAWADDVRPQRRATAPWHYLNAPRGVLRPSDDELNLPQGTVASAIVDHAEQLADRSLPVSQRREALKFLVHFVGDLHNPLHVAYGDDRGGNDFPVRYGGRTLSLHRYWDHDIFAPAIAALPSLDYARFLLNRFTPAERSRWSAQQDVRDWVSEGRGYLFAGLYPPLRHDLDDGEPMAVVDETYREVWLPVAERQLARAGARIAAVLNAIAAEDRSPLVSLSTSQPTQPD